MAQQQLQMNHTVVDFRPVWPLILNGTIKGKTPLDFDVKLQCTSCRYESTAVDICNISQM